MIQVTVTLTCSRSGCGAMESFEVRVIPGDLDNYAPVERQIWMQMLARGWAMGRMYLDGDWYPDEDRVLCPDCACRRLTD